MKNTIRVEIPESTKVEFSEDNGFAVMKFVPEEVKFEVGKWYEYDECIILNLENKIVGFKYGEWWTFNDKFCNPLYKPADMKEVERLLIQEAEKRGFKKGVKYRLPSSNTVSKESDGDVKFCDGYLYGLRGSSYAIFNGRNGKWAEVVNEPIYVNPKTNEEFFEGDTYYWVNKCDLSINCKENYFRNTICAEETERNSYVMKSKETCYRWIKENIEKLR